MEELKGQIKIVAELREKVREIKEQKAESFIAWEKANSELLESIESNTAALSGHEELLRQMVLETYSENGEKNPAPGVGIREYKKINYEPAVAFDWAVNHKMALKLDVSAFEKIAKASPLEFVTITTVPQATIAADLSEALKEQEVK